MVTLVCWKKDINLFYKKTHKSLNRRGELQELTNHITDKTVAKGQFLKIFTLNILTLLRK